MVVADDAAVSRRGTLPIDIRGMDGHLFRISIDDQPWTAWMPRADADHVVLDGHDGLRRVRVQARDRRGTRGPVFSDTITLDSSAPLVRAPRITLRSGSVDPGALPIPVRLTWSLNDPGASIASAELSADCGGTPLIGSDAARLGSAPGRSTKGTSVHWVASGTRCVSRATVVDAAGNETTTGDVAVMVRGIQEAPSSVLTYSSGWHTTRNAFAYGGAVRSSKALGKWVRLQFTGSEIALVSNKARDRGQVRIAIDGRYVTTVELRAPTSSSRRIVFHRRLRPGRHTIEVRTLGSKRQPDRGAQVDIDGFLDHRSLDPRGPCYVMGRDRMWPSGRRAKPGGQGMVRGTRTVTPGASHAHPDPQPRRHYAGVHRPHRDRTGVRPGCVRVTGLRVTGLRVTGLRVAGRIVRRTAAGGRPHPDQRHDRHGPGPAQCRRR